MTEPLRGHPTRHWHRLDDGRVQCDVCPRLCRLREGQRGFCFVRGRAGGEIVMTAYDRSSGFCVDPIEKKPLAHFLPGTSVLSFGTAGCNLGCRFCQNWDISASRRTETLAVAASPDDIVEAALRLGARSVAFTYNDPVVFLEYAADTAAACRAAGIRTVAVTAGYVNPAARADLFRDMDAANVDLKAFGDAFYRRMASAHLAPVLDTLRWLRAETDVWLEVTTLLIPGHNDGDAELEALTSWVVATLGPDVPLHLSAFHPAHLLLDVPPTPLATLRRAAAIARRAGIRHVYLGNVDDPEGETTRCPGCGAAVIRRDGYRIVEWGLEGAGRCTACGTRIAGVFEDRPGRFGGFPRPVLVEA